jgi:hypothetical protein
MPYNQQGEPIQWLIVELKRNGFNSKVESSLKHFLGFHVIEDKELNQIMILQPHLIKNLRKKLGGEVIQKITYRTPGTPRFKVIRHGQYSEIQIQYHSGFGMLIY